MHNKPKLSILILTHNRPELFKRCISSILDQDIPFEIEILVNNDSCDIKEIYKENTVIKYTYYQNNNLGEIYNLLYQRAEGKYIYFLEDDDYLVKGFFDKLYNLDLNMCLYYMNFISSNNTDEPLSVSLKRRNHFQMEEVNNNFQLSQILFKKSLIEKTPTDNELDNDWKMFQAIKKKANNIHILADFMFVQTCDGKDNISFEEFNNDTRFKMLNEAV